MNEYCTSDESSLNRQVSEGFPDEDECEEAPTCFFCLEDFTDDYLLQAHLATQKHFPLNEMLTFNYSLSPRCHCIVCKSEVRTGFGISHRCMAEVARQQKSIARSIFGQGSPLVCIMCSDVKHISYYHNLIHIIVKHGYEGKMNPRGNNPCPFCHAPFNTDKRSAIEYHAVKEHMPEIYMEYFREMQPDGIETAILKTGFFCKIPQRLYDHFQKKENKKRHCMEHCSSIITLTSHVQTMHSPIPNRPLMFPLEANSCRFCLVPFPDSQSLREHILRKHDFLNRQRVNYSKSQNKLVRNLDSSTCKFCWQSYRNLFQLQVHIQSAHQGSWRICGLCGREFCKVNEIRSAKLVYMEMVAHERHHARKLVQHAQKMFSIDQGIIQPFKVTPEEDDPDMYFSRINLDEAKRRRFVPKKDHTETFIEIGERSKRIQEEMLLMDKLVS